MKKKNAVAYARFSSTLQRDESIVRQLESIHEYCDRNNLELVEEYIDEAQSGTNDRRERFQDMIEDAQNSDWDFIVCYKMDRFSRSVADNMHYKKKLSKYGIRIMSVIEDFDDSSPEGNLFGLMTMGLSQFYVENLKRESFAGIMQNAKRCMTTGGTAPFGFNITEDLEYEINEHEAEGVRLMFKLIIDGYSYAHIINELNNRGFKTKFGNPFTSNIHDMLKNRKYIGEFVYNRASKKNADGSRNNHRKKSENDIVRIPEGIPRIVDDRTFFTVQRMMMNRRYQGYSNGTKTKYILSGLIVCSNCNFSISGMISYAGRKKIPRVRYTCQSSKKGRDCNVNDINALYYEKYVWSIVDEILNYKNIKKLQDLINKQLTLFGKKLQEEIDKLNEAIERNSKIVNELTERVGSLRSSADKILTEQIGEYMDIIIEYKNEKMYFEEDLKVLEYIYQKDLKQRIKKYRNIMNSGKENQLLLRRLIQRIYQGNDFVKILLRLNAFIPFKLYNDLTYEKSEIRDNIAFKYNNKRIEPLFK